MEAITMKSKRFVLLLAMTIVSLISSRAFALEHLGYVTLFHLSNYASDQRGACIRMLPEMPDTGWACVWQDNHLYKEITDLLLKAAEGGSGLICKVHWNES